MTTKRILCFGDSNTWGYKAGEGSRYPSDIRWTGRLQTLLGPNYQIIEEGLNGRTTNLDYATRKGKNGLHYLYPCLDSHHPLDLVILCLGPNDMKVHFNRSAAEIAGTLEKLIQVIFGEGLERPSPNVQVLVLIPIRVREEFDEEFKGAAKKSADLAALLRAWEPPRNVHVLDLFEKVEPDPRDGVHLPPEGHEVVAQLVADKVRQIL